MLAFVAIFLYARAQTSFYSFEKSAAEGLRYRSITMAEAGKLFQTKGNYRIVDVRRAEEYASGHFPSVVNIPNGTIEEACPAELPDRDQVINVYCRSGNRSRQASARLADLGYAHIVERGGILDWAGEIEKSAAENADIVRKVNAYEYPPGYI